MSEHNQALLERLRGQIRRLGAQPRTWLMALSTGVEAFDALGVLRLGGAVELCGEEASGRTTLALSVVAAACREKRLSAWVDGPQELYPPAAVSLGVELARLLIVRPPAPRQLVWSAVQLLRSGAFSCVVLDLTHTGVVPSLFETKKLSDAARTGGSLLVLLTSLAAPAQGLVRLSLRQRQEAGRGRGHLRCVGGGEAPEGLGAGDEDGGGGESDDGLGFLVETPRGRRVEVRRARLSRQRVPVRRAATIGEAPRPLRPAPVESFARPRKNLERDGYGMAGQWRPGREGPLALPPSLGAARSWR